MVCSCFSVAFACSSALMFFSASILAIIGFLIISSSARDSRALRNLDLAVVLRRGRALLRLALADLLLEIGELRAAVERVGQLLLPVELDDEVARLHGAAGPHQPRDHERLACSDRRGGERRWWSTGSLRPCR